MKKRFIIFAAVLLICVSGLFARNSLCYSRKCDQCVYEFKVERKTFISIGIATRHFEIKHRDIDGKKYTCYKCQFGHVLWICLDDGSWYNFKTKK